MNDTIILENKSIYIPKGSNRAIITYLRDKYKIRVNLVDAYILASYGGAKSGHILLSKNRFKREEFLKELANPKLNMRSMTLIPGETIYNFFQNIAKKYHLSFEKLMNEYKKVAPYPDGVIFPDTYLLSSEMKEKGIVGYLYNYSMKKHKALAKELLGKYDKKEWFRYITIASIIQKESANKSEMPFVASVIYNRLKRGMKLQMDGTLNYGKYSHTKVTPERIRDDNSLFNTYKIAGIPKAPICSVEIEAIKSAIKPAKTDYLYFVKGKDGTHLFSSSYKQHLRNIKNGNK